MAGFFYFFPARLGAVEGGNIVGEVIEPLGLLPIFRDCMCLDGKRAHATTTSCGPNEENGVVVYPIGATRAPGELGYSPGKQTWYDRGEFWIGHETSHVPEPEDLVRRDVSRGYMVRDEHDRRWCIPIIRSDYGRSQLPVYMGFEPGTRKPVEHFSKEFQPVWELAGEALDYLVQDEELEAEEHLARWPLLWQMETAIAFLQISYRIGMDEIDVLTNSDKPFFVKHFWDNVLMSGSDFSHVLEMMQVETDVAKKKDNQLAA